ncbi:condensin complex protein MksE [Comamonas testosteroni]|uniref:condensin complex protein MksE n=1 Tax=Comamonas testosteroni TaxID=285 RepID=UPI00391D6C38
MSALESALKRLAEGQFICQVQFPEEFEALDAPDGRRQADEWLGAIGYRLARLHEEGAFFMAHAIVTNEMRMRFREELRMVRNRLEPAVGFMEALRQAQGRDPRVHAGDMVWESEISEAVRNSSLLEQRIMEMRDISGLRPTDSVNDRVRRMLEHLRAEGYLVESNPTNRGYQLTGKVDYLYQLIAFIAANTPQLSEDDVSDQVDTQARQTSIEDGANTYPDAFDGGETR